MTEIKAVGLNGQLILGKGYIEIQRKGMMAFMSQGLKGDKKIALKQISAVQFKVAGWTNGYIQFSFVGGVEAKQGIFQGGTDENSIIFTKKQQPEFEKIKEKIEKVIYT